MLLWRFSKHARSEMKELETTAKEHDEQLSQLKDRIAAVTAELSQLKLNSSLAEALVEEASRKLEMLCGLGLHLIGDEAGADEGAGGWARAIAIGGTVLYGLRAEAQRKRKET